MAGCAVGPDYQRPGARPGADGMEGGHALERGAAAGRRDQKEFWEVFDDAVLTGLEEEATSHSPDVRAAFERVEQARAMRASAGRTFTPS